MNAEAPGRKAGERFLSFHAAHPRDFLARETGRLLASRARLTLESCRAVCCGQSADCDHFLRGQCRGAGDDCCGMTDDCTRRLCPRGVA